MNKSEKIKHFLIAHVETHPHDVVAVAMKEFGLTRPGVHLYLSELIKEGLILKSGSKRTVSYSLPHKNKVSKVINIVPGIHEDEVWAKYFKSFFEHFSHNIFQICSYGFSEMLNNVIDHSGSDKVSILAELEKTKLTLAIKDKGVGIFNKIQKAMNLQDPRESVLHLTKGKFTTDPSRHSGEGIFFTSRIFDTFVIKAGNLFFTRLNKEDDVFVETQEGPPIDGTVILLEIDINSKKTTMDVFREHTNPETFNFDKTTVYVQLAKLAPDDYISRSQAKRTVMGLEKFKRVVLDFSNVLSIGQGFADEIFRVFATQHPEIDITYVNASDDVKFMIQRSMASRIQPKVE